MALQTQAEAFFLVLLAAFLSMIVGLDRERREHPAGLRTHMLVGVGACVFTILSMHAFAGSDPARVASQILPGIGFLGAGAILKEKRHVKGLTTAAGVWSTAAIGMAVGSGAWLLALSVTVIIWTILSLLQRFEGNKNGNNVPVTEELADAHNNRANKMPARPNSSASWAE